MSTTIPEIKHRFTDPAKADAALRLRTETNYQYNPSFAIARITIDPEDELVLWLDLVEDDDFRKAQQDAHESADEARKARRRS